MYQWDTNIWEGGLEGVVHPRTQPYSGSSGLGKVEACTKTDLPTVCQLIELVSFGRSALQVFLSGKMVVFNKNCLEIATKTVLFKTFAAGLDAEFQIAMLSNLVCFFLRVSVSLLSCL